MANNPATTYLPPGWTEEKYKNATDQDYEALTEEQLDKIMERRAAETHMETVKWLDEKNAKRIARGATPLPYPNDIVARGQDEEAPPTSLPDPATESLKTLINHVKDSNLDLIGFVLFRTHYTHEQRWEAFETGFYELLDEGIATACDESADFKRIEEKVFMRIVSDDALENQPSEGVARAYRTCMEDEVSDSEDDEEDTWGEKIEPGLTTSMCLFVDEECIRSVVDKTAGSSPFVKAVDGTLGMGQRQEYKGTIKVAITSLMPAFYAALLGFRIVDVASQVSEDGIWRNMGPWDPELEGRRIQERSSLGGT
ncbi:hypothetical protein KC332_g14282 [Hortaea werneckii]|uniref:Uncharacterized protein n=2 Tax=Hortaea werneckii TaxID=91943 RepID=A0A3M7IXL1_HORWE|nr:hypothetical protein KC358_g11993 [Hortaea werneckii]OTA31680.1 hypothetical protein BTJ68_07781 [Hortaea werneckii EXF-2000]KAI6813682.1 hypothetical protein KC350_g11516 [Hortaea werneckii]KAI6915473.1 hypothetical protein KC348_g12016 [Hortaea werneckii]KAI6928428.1 hypothetical protein KC341_g11536 [Hortaea werneckii]